MQEVNLKTTLSVALLLTIVLPNGKAEAHRSGCHRWHSCPSDTNSYVCGDLGYTSQCPPSTQRNNSSPNTELMYEQYMKIGNNALGKQDYQTALINFKRALKVRPGDSAAMQAINSVESKVKQKKRSKVQIEQESVERRDD